MASEYSPSVNTGILKREREKEARERNARAHGAGTSEMPALSASLEHNLRQSQAGIAIIAGMARTIILSVKHW